MSVPCFQWLGTCAADSIGESLQRLPGRISGLGTVYSMYASFFYLICQALWRFFFGALVLLQASVLLVLEFNNSPDEFHELRRILFSCCLFTGFFPFFHVLLQSAYAPMFSREEC
jgi:hypothetical protein